MLTILVLRESEELMKLVISTLRNGLHAIISPVSGTLSVGNALVIVKFDRGLMS